MGEDRPYDGSYSGNDDGNLRLAYCHCVYAEVSLVYCFSVSGVICMMYGDIRWVADLVDAGKITVNQAREIVNAETIEILYANNELCIIFICNAGEPTKEIGLYSEDYETHKLEMVKVNATMQDVIERCIYGEISYQDAHLWCLSNDIPFRKFDRQLYYALRNQGRDIPEEPTYWLHRLALFFKRCFDWLLNSILEVFT